MLALELERTLSALDKKAIKQIRRDIRNMPNVLSSLTNSRQDDVLLTALESVISDQKATAGLGAVGKRLRQLKASGVEDADIDLRLAMEDEDFEAAKNALERGADPSKSLGEVVDRYKNMNLD
ncbi:spermidine/putrescine ABC transporter ATP-binding protein [Mycobacterium intracellulare]|nr:spermidine/putrescine ABC transporter ATP-binding protein [Mycobacterium intracellulare]